MKYQVRISTRRSAIKTRSFLVMYVTSSLNGPASLFFQSLELNFTFLLFVIYIVTKCRTAPTNTGNCAHLDRIVVQEHIFAGLPTHHATNAHSERPENLHASQSSTADNGERLSSGTAALTPGKEHSVFDG